MSLYVSWIFIVIEPDSLHFTAYIKEVFFKYLPSTVRSRYILQNEQKVCLKINNIDNMIKDTLGNDACFYYSDNVFIS